jgi:hypothetical protein
MKHWVACLSTIVFVSVTALAQSPDRGAPVNPPAKPGAEPLTQPNKDAPRKFVYDFKAAQGMIVQAASPNGGCPVSMQAQHRSNPSLMNARDAAHEPLAQRIHLTVSSATYSSGILSIKVTVRGTTAKARALLVSTFGANPSDAAMTFDLRANQANADQASAVASDLLLRGFTSVQTVDLESVTYADGSSWVASATRSCSIEPDNLMLVSR